MSLKSLIDQAIEKVGSQVKLAEQMNVQQQVVSAWRTGRRTCTTAHRIELCKIANYDLKVALIEQVIEGLDQNDQTQAEAGAMLQAVVDAFPNAGWRRLYLANCRRRASRAVVWFRFLVNKSLDHRLGHAKSLTHTLQGV